MERVGRFLRGRSALWEVCVGIEIHAQVRSASKLFSRAATGGEQAAPNSCVSLFDASIPGTLPLVNTHAVDQAVRTGLALRGDVRDRSVFERKHYFYHDLPLGYQITQQRHPIVVDGSLEVPATPDGKGRAAVDGPPPVRRVRITRIQLEQDSGKSIHDLVPGASVVDLNRAGAALMELVTEPDLRSGPEAVGFVRTLAHLLRHIGACDGNMALGQLRCDVNVSVRRDGEESFGERVEVKNLNSTRSVGRAIDVEAQRQVALIEAGEGPVAYETMGFNAASGRTERMRAKETAKDYRFLPDPDLPAVALTQDRIHRLKQSLPELPDALRARLVEQYGVSPTQAEVLVGERNAAAFFEAAVDAAGGGPALAASVANWLVNDLFGLLKKQDHVAEGQLLAACAVEPRRLGALVDRVAAGSLSSRMGKEVLEAMVAGECGGDPDAIAEARNLRVNRDEGELRDACAAVLASAKGQKAAAKYYRGYHRMVGGLVGEVMKATKGAADPKMATAIVTEMLEAGRPAEGGEQ